LEAGSFTGNAPSVHFGRQNNNDNGSTYLVTGDLSIGAGTLRLHRGKILEAGTITVTTGGELFSRGYGSSETDAIIRSVGDFVLAGGILNTVHSSGTGGYILEVGGNFGLETGSTVSLMSATGSSPTTLELSGNYDVSATSLTSGNLNELSVVLDNAGTQFLEAAVTDDNKTFNIYSLTFVDGGSYTLTNSHMNVGMDEYFQTSHLFNTGSSVLNLNGLQFFVDDMELTPGVYNDFGGVLTVVPEPRAAGLLFGVLAMLFALRRRQARS